MEFLFRLLCSRVNLNINRSDHIQEIYIVPIEDENNIKKINTEKLKLFFLNNLSKKVEKNIAEPKKPRLIIKITMRFGIPLSPY